MPEYTNTEMFNLIDDYIHLARDRRVMKDRLINGLGMEALAEKYEVSASQMKRIVDRNQETLFRLLENLKSAQSLGKNNAAVWYAVKEGGITNVYY